MSRLRSGIAAALLAGLASAVVAQPPTPPTPPTPAPTPAPAPAPAPTPPAAPTPPPAAAPTPAPTPAPTTTTTADGKQTFALKLEKDKPFYEEMTTSVTQAIKVQGQDLTQKQDQTFSFEWTPVRQDGDKWVLKQKITAVKMNIDISGNPISYDSSNEAASGATGNPGLTDFFKNLKGSEFTVTLGKDNKVEKVDGRDDFIKKLSAGNNQLDGLLKKVLTDEALKQMTDPTFGLIPAQPKAVGETWESPKTTLALGPIGSYEVSYKFTYKGKEGANEKVEVVPTLVYKAPTENTDGLLFRIKGGDLKSTGTKPGTILYDAKAGRIVEATIPVELRGTLKVTIGGADTDVELSQTQTTTIKMTDKPAAAPEKK